MIREPYLTTEPSCSTISTRSSSTSTSSEAPSVNMMRYRAPPERTHHPTPGINRVCRRDPLDKSRKPEYPNSLSARVTNDDGGSPDDSGGASLTAVLLAFLSVSLLARGMAEGNRGRGLMVTLVDRPEDGGAVDDGSDGGVVDVATDLEELAGGGDVSLSGRRGAADGRECAAWRLVGSFGG